MSRAPVGLDVCHSRRFPSPGVVDEVVGIAAEKAVEDRRVRSADVRHRVDADSVQPPLRPSSNHPEIPEGSVVSELTAIALFIEDSPEVRTVLGHHIHGDLRQIEIRSHATGGSDAGGGFHVLLNRSCQTPDVRPVEGGVGGTVEKGLIHGVDVDVLRGQVPEVDSVNPGGVVYVEVHPGHGLDVLQIFRNLKDPAAVSDPQGLEMGRDGQAYGPVSPGGVRHDQVRRQRIHLPLYAFDRGIEGFEVDAEVAERRFSFRHQLPPFRRLLEEDETSVR